MLEHSVGRQAALQPVGDAVLADPPLFAGVVREFLAQVPAGHRVVALELIIPVEIDGERVWDCDMELEDGSIVDFHDMPCLRLVWE